MPTATTTAWWRTTRSSARAVTRRKVIETEKTAPEIMEETDGPRARAPCRGKTSQRRFRGRAPEPSSGAVHTHFDNAARATRDLEGTTAAQVPHGRGGELCAESAVRTERVLL